MNEPPKQDHLLMVAVISWILTVFTGCVVVVMVGQMRGTYHAEIPAPVIELCRIAVFAGIGGSVAGVVALIKNRKP